MNTVPVNKARVGDVAGQITYAMRSMGVSPIPRNYELFYEAYIGSNPALTRELADLGSHASQEELDAIAAKYFTTARSEIFENTHSRMAEGVEALLRALQQEQSSLETYNRLLDETCKRITSKSAASRELIENAIKILSDATGAKIAHGEQTTSDVQQCSQEMDDVRKELDEYKRIANTDSLTRLANRRAFDERLSTIYDSPSLAPVTGLVLADIDNFKRINDAYGHPVGDKILATVASVIRANVRRDVFVARSGGEEFAIIFSGNTEEEIHAAAERIRTTLEKTPFRNSRTRIDYGPVTISIGLCMASAGVSPSDLYLKADAALYSAKYNGRNCTIIFEEGMQKDFSKSWLIYKSDQTS
ncbi:GGDEF domain-containing protein [Oryzifoliimicrobium ureilyticus]|uniref:GGDEF domain-containing protein n=1 Tax=Oryzifoliimicrobium ureilyticus TaxID=3113724 RepID=UPI0030766EB2